jgi:hypothetical protein
MMPRKMPFELRFREPEPSQIRAAVLADTARGARIVDYNFHLDFSSTAELLITRIFST